MPVCLNHNNQPATTRCATCFKPLCPACVVRRGRQVFCSTQCLDNFLHTSGITSRFLHHERQARRTHVKTVVTVAFVACLLAFALALLFALR